MVRTTERTIFLFMYPFFLVHRAFRNMYASYLKRKRFRKHKHNYVMPVVRSYAGETFTIYKCNCKGCNFADFTRSDVRARLTPYDASEVSKNTYSIAD